MNTLIKQWPLGNRPRMNEELISYFNSIPNPVFLQVFDGSIHFGQNGYNKIYFNATTNLIIIHITFDVFKFDTRLKRKFTSELKKLCSSLIKKCTMIDGWYVSMYYLRDNKVNVELLEKILDIANSLIMLSKLEEKI